jgi:(R,R)-butanediol dehydrogenase / meso-butanediol dehydrogenase / diacetyl reductase
MLAVRWHGRNDVRVEEIPPLAPPGPGEVQLRIAWCGICGTDLEEVREGPLFIPTDAPHPITGRSAPLTLGHELTGVVVSNGPRVDVALGSRVAVDPIVFCGKCEWCCGGQVVRCDRMGSLGLQGDGGLAEFCNVPARTCLPVPDGLSDDAAALAEPLSVAVRALRRGRMERGDRVAVVGAGPVGLLALQAAIALGASSVSALDRIPARRRLALELGATLTSDEAIPHDADVAVEAAGNAAGVAAAIASLRKGGRAVLLGIHQQPLALSPLDLVANENELVGSFSHVYDQDFPTAVELLGSGEVAVERIISDRIPLTRAVEDGLRALERNPERHLKILIGGTPAQRL